MPSLNSETKIISQKANKVMWVAFAIVLGLIITITALFFNTRSQLNQVKKELAKQQSDPTTKEKAESQELIDKIGKLVILPANETPTIATVSDLSKLKDQPFFSKAQVEDKVLIYQNAKKAILYRPSTNQIIELAPLNTNSQPGSPAGTAPGQ